MQAYQVLTLKYRPQALDEIWIQEHIKTTLKSAIETNRVAHAYLFTGPRGVGKTTTARILAKSLNCVKGSTTKPCQKCSVCKEITNSSNLDVLEIDGASNRGIDQVRELRENVKFLPTSCPYKIYIIDEVHMLTQEAFNALLKTLEEPPKHVKFIFATTTPQKVPATILSRCQRFDFRKAKIGEIVQRLSWICGQEKITVSEDALFAISKRSDGSIRDAEGMLDQLRVFKSDKVELSDVEDLLGLISSEMFFEYTELLLASGERKIFEFIDKVFSTGHDFMEFFSGLLEHFRLLMMVKLSINKTIIAISKSETAKYETQAKRFNIEKLLIIMQIIADNEEIVKRTAEPQILFEIFSLNLLYTLANNPIPTKININEYNNQDSDIQVTWQNIVNEMATKRPSLASLLESTIISGIDENTIQIITQQGITKDFIQADKIEIERQISQQIGRPIKIIINQIQNKSDNSDIKKNGYSNADIHKFDKSESTKTIGHPDKIIKELFPNAKKIK